MKPSSEKSLSLLTFIPGALDILVFLMFSLLLSLFFFIYSTKSNFCFWLVSSGAFLESLCLILGGGIGGLGACLTTYFYWIFDSVALKVRDVFLAVLSSSFLLASASWCRVSWHLQMKSIHPRNFFPNSSEDCLGS